MNKREARRIAEADETPYGVHVRGGGAALYRVSGYRNAKIVQRRVGGVILTASEMKKLESGA